MRSTALMVLLALATLAGPSSAGAVDIQAVEAPPGPVAPGEPVTVKVRLAVDCRALLGDLDGAQAVVRLVTPAGVDGVGGAAPVPALACAPTQDTFTTEVEAAVTVRDAPGLEELPVIAEAWLDGAGPAETADRAPFVVVADLQGTARLLPPAQPVPVPPEGRIVSVAVHVDANTPTMIAAEVVGAGALQVTVREVRLAPDGGARLLLRVDPPDFTPWGEETVRIRLTGASLADPARSLPPAEGEVRFRNDDATPAARQVGHVPATAAWSLAVLAGLVGLGLAARRARSRP